MAYFVQKDVTLGQFNISVQVDANHSFEVIPENPHVVQVHQAPIVFHVPNHRIPSVAHPDEQHVYRVESHWDGLRVVAYPLS